jgi:hypothetical protein
MSAPVSGRLIPDAIMKKPPIPLSGQEGMLEKLGLSPSPHGESRSFSYTFILFRVSELKLSESIKENRRRPASPPSSAVLPYLANS